MPGCIETHTKFYAWANFNVSDKAFQFFWIVKDGNSLKFKIDGAYIFFRIFMVFGVQNSKIQIDIFELL